MDDRARAIERAKRRERAFLSAAWSLDRALKKIDYDLGVVKPRIEQVVESAKDGVIEEREFELPGPPELPERSDA